MNGETRAFGVRRGEQARTADSLGAGSVPGAGAEGLVDKELAQIVRRLEPDWPAVDVAAVVVATYQRLAENARVTSYLPILTEHLVRTGLSKARRVALDEGTDRPGGARARIHR